MNADESMLMSLYAEFYRAVQARKPFDGRTDNSRPAIDAWQRYYAAEEKLKALLIQPIPARPRPSPFEHFGDFAA